ncbi:MAG: Gldg family protein [Kofleriaceae bacterium]
MGLLSLFVGERLLGHTDGVRIIFTWIFGVGLLALVTGARAWTTVASRGARRRVERTLLICQLGALASLVLYALTTKWGIGALGIKDATRFTGALTVVWVIGMAASVVPMAMIELSLGVALRTGFDVAESDAGVEYYRVRDVGWSGLTIALAFALLMVTCQVAEERNVSRDVSYFKTSAPGDSTKAIASSSSEPIHVHLFFPDPNQVKDQVQDYFEALGAAAGKVEIKNHDRFVDADLAAKYKVAKDGVVVLARGEGDKEKFEKIELDTDFEKARRGAGKLRNLDKEVNSMLMKLVREKRKAYLVTGHGELNSPDSMPSEVKSRVQERRTSLLKKKLNEQNYEVKDLGLIELAKEVPDDATVVLLLAPTVPLQSAEWATLDRYLARGGRLMIALDPTAEPSLGVLEGRLGVKYNPASLTDDKEFLPQRGTNADKRWVITTQFSAHASTTSLSRSVGKGLVVIDSGALEDAPFTGGGEAPKKTVTIRSMESSWLDLDNNFAFDDKTEKRQRWNLGVAIEGPKVDGKDGFRALVFSDVDLFVDMFVQNMGRIAAVMVSGPLFDDSVRWLGGEEVFAGEIVSEDDKKIEHTKSQDAVWFTLTIIGAPLIVLTLGLVGTWARRRRPTKKAEVTP